LNAVADFQTGVHYADITALGQEHDVVAALTRAPGMDEGFLFLATEGGNVKRIEMAEVPGVRSDAFQVMIVADDVLGWAEWTDGQREVILVSAEGKAIRFLEEEVRPMGLRAAGVKGVKLGSSADQVVGMDIFDPQKSLWTITNAGVAKSSPMADYPLQGRYGQGVITFRFPDKQSRLVASAAGTVDDNLIVVTNKGKPKYMRLGLAPQQGRNTSGGSVIALGPDEQVIRVVVPRRPSIQQIASPSAEQTGIAEEDGSMQLALDIDPADEEV